MNRFYFLFLFLLTGSIARAQGSQEVLVEGEITLVYQNNMYFVKGKNSTEYTHLSPKEGKLILRKLTKGCPDLSATAGGIRLDRAELVAFVKAYNECVITKEVNLDNLPKPFSIGVVIGGENSSCGNFQYSSGAEFMAASNHKDKSFLQGGVDITVRSYKIIGSVALYGGVLFNTNSYSGVNKWTPDNKTQNAIVNEYSYSYKELRFPLGFQLNRLTRKQLSSHMRIGVMIPTVFDFTSANPHSEAISLGGSRVDNLKPSTLKSYHAKIMFGGAVGADYRVFDRMSVRLQLNAYIGEATATVASGGTTNSVDGRVISCSIVAGLIF